MRRMFGFIGIIAGTQFIVSLPAIADTTWVNGIISADTTWIPAGNPYIVTDSVIVDSAITLDIEPGVEVKIDSAKYIMIKGTMNAIGTVTDSIIISARDTTKRWSRLWFKDASAGSLCYCRIEYAGNSAIYDSSASSLVIEYNTITGNSTDYDGGGIHSYGSPTITGNTITGNLAESQAESQGGGIYSEGGSPTISANTITNNSANGGGGIYSKGGSPTISGNTITDNSAKNYDGGGIYSKGGSPTISGNTITGNSARGGGGGGICNYSGSPTISGNTITNNSFKYYGGGGIYSMMGASPTIKHNTITDTTASAIYIHSDSAKINSNNLYVTGYAVWNNSTSNIDARYNYWGTVSSDTIELFRIRDFYDDSTTGVVYYEPFLTDTFGIEEPSNSQLSISNSQLSIYPNPSFSNTTIKYEMPKATNISLRLYDISGRLVKTIYSGTQEKGYHKIEIPRREFRRGIYFIRFKAGEFESTRKLILM